MEAGGAGLGAGGRGQGTESCRLHLARIAPPRTLCWGGGGVDAGGNTNMQAHAGGSVAPDPIHGPCVLLPPWLSFNTRMGDRKDAWNSGGARFPNPPAI